MKLMKITPNDTLFLGSSKYLDISKNNKNRWINSMIFPLPNTFYGAIASVFLSNNLQILKAPNKDKRVIEIGKSFLFDGFRFYVNFPHDCVYNSEEDEFRILKFKNKEFQIKKDFEYPERVFIEYESLFSSYFKNKTDFNLEKLGEELFSYKVGIKLGENKQSEVGYLYRIDQLEFDQKDEYKKWSFVVEFKIHGDEYNEIPRQGFLKLGGENKSCKYEIINTGKELISNNELKIKNGELKLKLLAITPLILKENILEQLEKNFIDIEGVNAAKPLIVSGYVEKTKQEVLPSGSIIILTIKNNKVETIGEIKKILKNELFDGEIKGLKDGFSEFEVSEFGGDNV